MELVLLATVGLLVVGIDVVLIPRTIRSLRAVKAKGAGFRERWRSLDPEHRKRLARTIRRGEPAVDPADATVALDAIGNAERLFDAIGPIYVGVAPTTLFLAAVGFVDGDPEIVVVGLALTACVLVGLISVRRRRQKLRALATAIRARGAAR